MKKALRLVGLTLGITVLLAACSQDVAIEDKDATAPVIEAEAAAMEVKAEDAVIEVKAEDAVIEVKAN